LKSRWKKRSVLKAASGLKHRLIRRKCLRYTALDGPAMQHARQSGSEHQPVATSRELHGGTA
ncbi:MAG: hypothetical protein R6U98_02155, partial [Pirellulaceae bacterium]